MASAQQQRLDETLSRLDSLLDSQARRAEIVEARLDAQAEAARVQRLRDHAEARRQIQAVYADAYRGFGSEPPMPLAW